MILKCAEPWFCRRSENTDRGSNKIAQIVTGPADAFACGRELSDA